MPEIERAKPAYVQIYDHLRVQILKAELAPGAQLPSVRALAEAWSVQPNTAARAVAALQQDGLVEAMAGKGTFVARQIDTADFAEVRAEVQDLLAKARKLLQAASTDAAELRPDQFEALSRAHGFVDSADVALRATAP